MQRGNLLPNEMDLESRRYELSSRRRLNPLRHLRDMSTWNDDNARCCCSTLTEMRENVTGSVDMFRKFVFSFDFAKHCRSRIIQKSDENVVAAAMRHADDYIFDVG